MGAGSGERRAGSVVECRSEGVRSSRRSVRAQGHSLPAPRSPLPAPRSFVATGTVIHHRTWPHEHAFSYRTGWLMLDTQELPRVLDHGWWSGCQRPGLLRYHRADLLAGAADLDCAVRDRVERETGERPAGAIQVLTNLRMAGHCFNPVSFYFCRDTDGAVRFIVAEITNTPWGERFAYVLGPHDNSGTAADHRYGFDKRFHVSPFHPMQQRYAWRFRFTTDAVSISMANLQAIAGEERQVFSAALTVRLTPVTPQRLLRHMTVWPLMTVRVLAAIYVQALCLWWKRTPFFANPRLPVVPESA